MSSRVLVTGGAGFIGSHVVDRLAAAGYRPRIFDSRSSPWHPDGEIDTVIGDVRRPEDVLAAAKGCSAICHLAAAADVGEVRAHPVWATELNAMGTLSVLEAARQLGAVRVIYASTVWVYSDSPAQEVSEDDLFPAPAHLYTAGKLSGELYCCSYAELYDVQSTVLRFGIPYGPRARPAAVIPSFVERARRGENLSIAGTGDQERSFIYVEDLADGVVRALAPQAVGRTYNLAANETTTIRELAEIVCEEVAPVPIVHTEGRPGDLRGARVRTDRAEAELQWRPSTPLREGVRRYAEWLEGAAAGSTRAAAVAPARADHPKPALRRGAAWSDPLGAGIIALIGVICATAAVALGAPNRAEAADFSVAGLALLLPLWSLTVTPWPSDLRRAKLVTILATGVLDVVVLGSLSGDRDAPSDLHGRVLLAFIILVAGSTALLHVVPRRVARAPG